MGFSARLNSQWQFGTTPFVTYPGCSEISERLALVWHRISENCRIMKVLGSIKHRVFDRKAREVK